MNKCLIKDVSILNPSFDKRKYSSEDVASFVPMAAVSDKNNEIEYEQEGRLSKFSKGYTYFEKGDILLAKITPCFENGKLAIANISHQIGFGSTEFYVIRADPNVVLPKYLFYVLKSPKFRLLGKENMTGSAGQKRLRRDFLENFQFLLPTLDEQKDIVTILDQVVFLLNKRQKSFSLLNSYINSLFIQMFGDPVENSKDLDIIKFGSIIKDISYGSSRKSMADQKSDSLPILRIPNIVGGKINYENLQFQSLPVSEKNKLKLRKGDILFVRTNGNPDYIGRCAVFDDNKEFIFASYLIRARLKENSGFEPIFVRYCFSIDSYKSKIRKESRTTAGNYNINTQGIKNFDLIMPPIKQQEKFVEAFNKAEAIKTNMLKQSIELEIQLQSIMQNSFSIN